MKFLWQRLFSSLILVLFGTSTTFLVFQNCAPAQFSALEQASSSSVSSTSCDANTYTPQPYTNADLVGTCSCGPSGQVVCNPTGCKDPTDTFSNGVCSGPSVSTLSVLIYGNTSTSLVPSTNQVPVTITATGPIHSLVTGTGIAKIGGTCSVASIDPSQLSVAGGQFALGAQSMIYDTSLAVAMAGCTWRITGVADNGRSAYADFTALLCGPGTADPSHPTCTTADGKSGHTVCSANGLSYDCVPNSSQNCTFNNQTINDGGSVVAYPNLTVGYGQVCTGETRICHNGVLSGTAANSSCTVSPGAPCSFNGQTINDGASAVGYTSASVAFGSTCSSGPMVCHNGNLVGNYPFATCSVQGNPNCTYNGNNLSNGQSVTLFKDSAVASGLSCQSETLLCNNGSISGATAPYYQFGSCSVLPPAKCNFNGTTISDGGNVIAWLDSVVPYGQACQSQSRVCHNGSLDGSYTNSACTVTSGAPCSYNGQSVVSGSTISGFASTSVPFGSSCQAKSATCNNGTLSATVYPACSPGQPAPCNFNGQTVANGASVTAWQDSVVAFGGTCVSQTRTCSNGALSGSYTNSSCSTTPGAACTYNNQQVTSGSSVQGFTTATVPFAQTCTPASATCTNGSLSANLFPTCSPLAPLPCSFNGTTIASGHSLPVYPSATVPYGSSCPSSDSVACTNGVLSGNTGDQYASCSVAGPAPCVFQGQTYTEGQQVTAFTSPSVAYGASCASEVRTCHNGTFSGSAQYPACSPNAPANCSFNGQTILHGQPVTAYLSASGTSCPSETATCNNGSLPFDSGYTYPSCSVVSAPSCQWNIYPTTGGSAPFSIATLNLEGTAAEISCQSPSWPTGYAECNQSNNGQTYFCGPGVADNDAMKANVTCACGGTTTTPPAPVTTSTPTVQTVSAFYLSKCGRASCGIGDPLVDGVPFTSHVCTGQALQDWMDNGQGAQPGWALPTISSVPAGTQCIIFIKVGGTNYPQFTDVIFFSGPPQPDALTTSFFSANGASVTSVTVPGLSSLPAVSSQPVTSTGTVPVTGGTSTGVGVTGGGACLKAARGKALSRGQKQITDGMNACD